MFARIIIFNPRSLTSTEFQLFHRCPRWSRLSRLVRAIKSKVLITSKTTSTITNAIFVQIFLDFAHQMHPHLYSKISGAQWGYDTPYNIWPEYNYSAKLTSRVPAFKLSFTRYTDTVRYTSRPLFCTWYRTYTYVNARYCRHEFYFRYMLIDIYR